MASRAQSFEDLATWGDSVPHVILMDNLSEEEEDMVDPTYIDPRPTIPEVEMIDRTVAELEAKLESLRLKKAHLLAMRALIGGIPPEILSRIFELGVHECNHLLPVISLVSRHWRDVALATASLWSYIRLDHDWGYARHPAFLRKLNTCLQRSQACKLAIDLDCRYLEATSELHQIMTTLEPHLDRCFSFHISISVPDRDWMSIVQEHTPLLGPSLEHLFIRLESEDQTPFTFLSQPCPRLSSIVLENTQLTCIRTALPALRSLQLIRDERYHSFSRISISFRELLDLLSTTPMLTDLRVKSALFLLDGTEPIFHPSPAFATFPELKSLTFDNVDSNNVALFLESSLLPALTRLSVCMDPQSEESMQWLMRLALDSPRRFPVLRHLDLRSCNIDGAALLPFVRALQHLPHLTALGLSSPPTGHIGARIFDILARAPPEPAARWLLPELQALCVQNCRDVSGHELLTVVQARNCSPDVASVRYLKIAQCYAFDGDVMDQLTRLVDTVRIT